MMEFNKIYNMSCLEGLQLLDDKLIDCCITSPPYWGLRDYGVDGQLGMESNPQEYIDRLVNIFAQVKRVLKDEGTLWVNIGDSYSSVHTGGHKSDKSTVGSNKIGIQEIKQTKSKPKSYGLKEKELVGIPWLLAFALRADGWYLRQDIIWAKPNPMPESVTDRCTKSHEYIFLLTKSPRYYFDANAIKEDCVRSDDKIRDRSSDKLNTTPCRTKSGGLQKNNYTKRNKRDVWFVATRPYRGSHFATFPKTLIEPCVLAGCPENGVVLDPFMGAGTTGLVAIENNRKYIGFELNKEYCDIANDRIQQTVGELRFDI